MTPLFINIDDFFNVSLSNQAVLKGGVITFSCELNIMQL